MKTWSRGLILLAAVILLSCSGESKVFSDGSKETMMPPECVVLVHGLGRSYKSMADMGEALSREGFLVVSFDYPSTEMTAEQAAEDLFHKAVETCLGKHVDQVHFVTHSLGGIIVRQGLKTHELPKLGRVVMLSPPNGGSQIVDEIGTWRLYGWLNGPAGQQLGTADDSLPNSLGPVDYQVGIITGDCHAFFDSWFASLIPGRDDGKVSVEKAKIEGMTDFLVVHEGHPFIMDAEQVQAETVHFLRTGSFHHRNQTGSTVTGRPWVICPDQK